MAIPASVPASPNQLAARLTAPGRLSLAHWRVAFRLGWFAVIVGTFGLVALAIPVRYAQLLRTAQNVTPAQSLVVNDVLAVFGQSLEAHIRSVLVIEVGVFLAFAATGAFIVLRKRDGVALHLSATLVAFAAFMSPLMTALANSSTT